MPAPAGFRAWPRHAGAQPLGVRVLGVVKDAGSRAAFDHYAAVQHECLVGELAYDGQVVADQDVGDAGLVADVGEQVENLGLDRHVEGRDGLVKDQDRELCRKRAGDRDTLPLAAGQEARQRSGLVGIEPIGPASSAIGRCPAGAAARRTARRPGFPVRGTAPRRSRSLPPGAWPACARRTASASLNRPAYAVGPGRVQVVGRGNRAGEVLAEHQYAMRLDVGDAGQLLHRQLLGLGHQRCPLVRAAACCSAAVIAGSLKPSRFATRRQNDLGEQRRRVGVVTVGHRREAVDARPGRGGRRS